MALTCKLRNNDDTSEGSSYIQISGTTGTLDIRFRQTVRVPDNKEANFMSPDLGPIPLYSVSKSVYPKLPEDMLKKRGVFLPLHGRF